MAHAWKACVRETVPWVRIPLSPPDFLQLPDLGRARLRLWPAVAFQMGGDCLGLRRWTCARSRAGWSLPGRVMANRKDRRKSAAVRRSSGAMSDKEKRQLIIGGLVVGGVVIAVLALFMWPR
jgi:hypothetical protein